MTDASERGTSDPQVGVDDPPVIVLAVDDDDASFRAAAAVTRWFRDDARVVALHVASVPRGTPDTSVEIPAYESLSGYPWGYPSAFVFDSTQAVEQGRVLAHRAAAIAGGEAMVREGGAPQMITSVANSVGADVIVVGTSDRSWLSRLFDVSVSRHVAHNAPCSVLVVREKENV